MPSSLDNGFLDTLASLPSDISGGIETTFDKAAVLLRRAVHASGDTLSTVVWVPDQLRSPPPPPARLPPAVVPLRYTGYARRWIADHPALVAALIGFFGTGTLAFYQQRRAYMKKRRAKRAHNGARKEIVVVSGNLNSPVARSVVLDLERRGFIVYVICSSAAEEETVKGEGKPDVIPLHLRVSDPLDVDNTLSHFNQLLTTPQYAASGTTAHQLQFTGLVIIPDLTYPAGPVETVSPEFWSDALNAKVLGTVATTQAFLRTVIDVKARIVLLSPNIIPSLRPAFHSVESTIVGALDNFIACLRAEMVTVGVEVCQIKMGNFDTTPVGERGALQRNWRADILSWASAAREAYAENYLSAKEDDRGRGILTQKAGQRGSSLRTLNNSVFDALTQRRPWSIVRSGRGSILYDIIGSLAPVGLVGWMIGLRRKHHKRDVSASSTASSAHWEQV